MEFLCTISKTIICNKQRTHIIVQNCQVRTFRRSFHQIYLKFSRPFLMFDNVEMSLVIPKIMLGLLRCNRNLAKTLTITNLVKSMKSSRRPDDDLKVWGSIRQFHPQLFCVPRPGYIQTILPQPESITRQTRTIGVQQTWTESTKCVNWQSFCVL